MSAATEPRETGMLDVGTHCAFCRELDFLPFHCSGCDKDFCSNHRLRESHYCESLQQRQEEKPSSTSHVKVADNGGKFFKGLLPEKGYIRVNNVPNNSNNNTVPRKTEGRTIRSTLNNSALTKLKHFFQKNHNKQNKLQRMKIFKPNKIVELNNLKKLAKGDSKIPLSNRIYIWCYCVENGNDNKSAVFINKIWPLGRVLDYLAKQLNVKNINNSFKATTKEKLYLYKEEIVKAKTNESDEVNFHMVNLSGRASEELKDLDVIYLVRGEELPN
ncbi:hypothetical protein NCAS_0G02130 [Naumovozyma castellii]|uniref:AN1-type domain-containing protein n=1 Tax=Naumovozyma castellii TaxID=27288 RepID=G0VI66_NAUCA|nr:hypothetical protein NCAS_0G02130 [Naumovozyma castellii CBS 4309]CCC71100.1 hypothetical protein NCAS_0G02130 [Naumovozyma castellii CBS 4309]